MSLAFVVIIFIILVRLIYVTVIIPPAPNYYIIFSHIVFGFLIA